MKLIGWMVVTAVLVSVVAYSLGPDLARYAKMRSM